MLQFTQASRVAVSRQLIINDDSNRKQTISRDFFLDFLLLFLRSFAFCCLLLNHTNELDPRLSASIYIFNWHHAAKGTNYQHWTLCRSAVPSYSTFWKRRKSRWWTSDVFRSIGTLATQFSVLKEMRCKKIYDRSPMLRLNVSDFWIDSFFCVIGMSIKFVSLHCPPGQPVACNLISPPISILS